MLREELEKPKKQGTLNHVLGSERRQGDLQQCIGEIRERVTEFPLDLQVQARRAMVGLQHGVSDIRDEIVFSIFVCCLSAFSDIPYPRRATVSIALCRFLYFPHH